MVGSFRSIFFFFYLSGSTGTQGAPVAGIPSCWRQNPTGRGPQHFLDRAWILCRTVLTAVTCRVLRQPVKPIGSVQMILLLSLTGFEVSIRTARFHDLESALQSIVRVDRPSLDVLDYAYRDDPLPQGSPQRAGTFHQEHTIVSLSGIDARNAPGPLRTDPSEALSSPTLKSL